MSQKSWILKWILNGISSILHMIISYEKIKIILNFYFTYSKFVRVSFREMFPLLLFIQDRNSFAKPAPWHIVRRHIYDMCTTNFRYSLRSTIETAHLSFAITKKTFISSLISWQRFDINWISEKNRYTCKLIGTPD